MHFKKAHVSDDSYNHVMSLSKLIVSKHSIIWSFVRLLQSNIVTFSVGMKGTTCIDNTKLPLEMYLLKKKYGAKKRKW